MPYRARAPWVLTSLGLGAVAVAVLLLALALSAPSTTLAAPSAQDPVTTVTVTWPTAAPAVYVKAGGTFTTSYSTDGASDPLAGSVRYQLGLNTIFGPFNVTLPVVNKTDNVVVPLGTADGVYDFQVLAANLGQTNWIAGLQVNSVIVDSTAPKVPTNTLISPNGGEFWQINSCHNIVWNAAGITDAFPVSIDLELWIAGVKVGNIATGLPNTSPYNWCLNPALVTITDQAKVRLIATDQAGNSASDTSDNNFTIFNVDKTPPSCDWVAPAPGYVKGTVPVQANAADAESGIKQVLFQVSSNLGSTWGNLATVLALPYQTTLNTTTFVDGSALLLRATCTNGNQVSVTTNPVQVIVDNSGPATAMNPVRACIMGSGDLGATASDPHSGITQVMFQNSLTGLAWTDIFADTSTPYSAPFNTITVPDGKIWFRDIATNGAGLTATSAPVTSRVDNTPPLTPTITMPISGTVWQSGTTVQIMWNTASVSDAGKLATNPVSLELVCVGDPQMLAAGLPNTGSWPWKIANVVPNTACFIRIIVTDECGNTTDNYSGDYNPEQIAGANFLSGGPFMVYGQDSTPPLVSITQPAAGLWFIAPVTVKATASDPESGIAKVEFFADSVSCGVDLTSPYEATCAAPANTAGPVTFKAVATNGVGAVAQATVVDKWDTVPPVVTLTPPATAIVSGTAYRLAATASDLGSGVAKVEFYYGGTCFSGGTLIASDPTAPYEASWDTTTAPDGGAGVWAKAYDVAGNTTLSTLCAGVNVQNTASIPLLLGWNLISTPLVPYNTSISAAFAGLPVKQVATFVRSGGVLTQTTWIPGVGGSLTTFVDGQGYWVQMNAPAPLVVKGAVLGIPPSSLPAYPIFAGWNMIGYTAKFGVPAEPWQDYLGLANFLHTVAIYRWNAAGGFYEVPPAAFAGQGYWLAVSEGGTIFP